MGKMQKAEIQESEKKISVENSEPVKWLSINGYAHHRRKHKMTGANFESVKKAITDGRIELVNGKIDPVAADKGYPPTLQPTINQHSSPGGVLDQRTEVKMDLESSKAKIAKLEYEERAGLLVRKSEVEKEAYSLGRQLRDQVMSCVERLIPELAAETNIIMVEKLLKTEMLKALAGIVEEQKIKKKK